MRISSFLLLGLLLLWPTQSAEAQTAPFNDNEKAVVFFDLRLDRIFSSELSESLGLQNQISMATQGDVDISKAVRVTGFASAPERVDQFQQMEGVEELPINFRVHIEFADEETLNQAINKIAGDSTEFTEGGKTYYRPSGDDAPKNVCAGLVNDTTLLMGTDAFVFVADQKAAYSEGLKSAIGSLGSAEDGFQLVFDLAGAKSLIDEVVQMGAQQGNPMLQGFLEVIPGMKDLRITMDFSGGDLFSLHSTCVDSEAASQLKGALDAIFGTAKLTGQQQLNQMKQQPGMEDVVAASSKILRSLTPKQEGNAVSVNVPKPEGFEDAVQQAGAMFGPMMMPGAGPGFDEGDDFGAGDEDDEEDDSDDDDEDDEDDDV